MIKASYDQNNMITRVYKEDTDETIIEPFREIEDDTLYDRFFSTPGNRALFFEESGIVEKARIFTDELVLQDIRIRRQEECFSIVDRSRAWYEAVYESFTDEQKTEFNNWYKAWLNAPDTRIIPKKPSWLK